jgi:oligoendopeptidase F
MKKYNSRSEVPEEYKWNLKDIFKDTSEYDKAFIELKNNIEKLSTYVGCTKDSNKLYEFLQLDNNTLALLYRINVYAFLINDQELGISENMDRMSKAEEQEAKYSNAVSFFSPELLELSKEEYESLFENDKLNEFKYILDNIYRSKEHILPSDKEILINELNISQPNYGNASATLLNKLNDYGTITIDGEEEKITQTNLRRLLKNENKDIRQEVRTKYNKVLDQYGDMSAILLNSYVKNNITTCKLHNFKDAWDEKLFNTKMPNEAYEALRTTVEENVDKLQKYFRIFKDTLKLDSLDMCDLNLEMVKLDNEYSIEEAQKLCLEAIKPLGEDYYNHFIKVFNNHYIDYAQYPGKCSGGYSAAGVDFDSRILLSYNYDLDSVSTIAHEGGHNVHHQYVNENNPIQYRDIGSLVSEVASLTNECLLSSYLAENGKDKKEKLKGIENILDVIVSNLFGAVREAKMEQDFYNYVNEGNNITKDYMNKLTSDSIDKYYGDTVNKDEFTGLSWIRRSHYYMDYYLYSYSICISIASYVASEILNGNKEMLDNYIKFLSTGTSIDNIEIFNTLGIDVTDKKVYEKAIEYFDSMLDKFVKLRDEA